MEIDVNILINLYKEELARLQNEVLLLKAQVRHLQAVNAINRGNGLQ